jgi:hypothetical protein
MGEIADDMIQGTTCSLCGQFFQGDKPDEAYSHGYPVVCWECWKNLNKREKKQHQRAAKPTL